MSYVRHSITAGLVLSLIFTGFVAAQEQAKEQAREPAKARPGPTEADAEYKIGPEDVLDIAVWNNTAISRMVPVRPDG